MLSAAVCGDVFASPSASQVFAAIKLAAGKMGVLLIVKNYTGDRLQFGKAAERAKRELGVGVEMVVVGDDCAIGRDRVGAGRRGLSGVLFVHKIAGYVARSGAPLEEVRRHAQHVADNIGTVGVALTPCTIPGAAPAFSIGPSEMELGLGTQRISLLSARETVQKCLDLILSKESDRSYLPVEDAERVVLLVNNLGGTTLLEINILVQNAVAYLRVKSIIPVRIYVGSLMTSLEMAGVSFTLLRLTSLEKDILQALDAPVGPSAWPRGSSPALDDEDVSGSAIEDEKVPEFARVTTQAGLTFAHALRAACTSIISSEPLLTSYDQIVGDGDCGTTLSRGAQALLDEFQNSGDGSSVVTSRIPFDRPADALGRMSRVLEGSMGGSYAASNSLSKLSGELGLSQWVDAVEAGVSAIRHYGGAQPGDRTMVDALDPLLSSLRSSSLSSSSPAAAMHSAANAARGGAESTSKMARARAGRTSYLSGGVEGTPDPGAVAVAVICESVAGVFG
ncbi:hypothetical protein HK104_001822 [Borealophlyctis nickersoniae]|nr:hypothetical protein HK104_001822 [Borealophlyctis nickersoniae]